MKEVVKNPQEAIALHLEDEDPTKFGLVINFSVLFTFELQPDYAKA